MKPHLSLPTIDQREGRILHITDAHLFADKNNTLLGVNSEASFLAVINEIKNRQKKPDMKPFDLIVSTGDVVQDGSQYAYERFAKQIKQFDVPCAWLAGNHDVYSTMDHVFNAHHLIHHKVILLGQFWLIILLNSQVEGHAYGLLSQTELDFLNETLHCYPKRLVLLFLHHHPILSGCHWLDEHALKNREKLDAIIQENPQIKGVGFGHIHQECVERKYQCELFSTPSTCVQFAPESYDFKLSNTASPSWREIELTAEGEIKTQVYQIDNDCFQPDLQQNGY